MKKAILTSTVEVRKEDLSAREIAQIKKALSIVRTRFKGEGTIKLWSETKTSLLLPRVFGHRFLQSRGFDFEDRRTDGRLFSATMDLDVLGKPPYPADQGEFVKQLVEKTKANGFGGFGVAPTGTGKTLMGTYAAAMLGGSTLILVHKTDLIENWVKSINTLRVHDSSPAIGMIQGEKELWSRVIPFTIATVQAIARKKHHPDMYSLFRTIIFDECHHVPAETFHEVLRQFPARYVIGLTATLRRKDGTEDVFKHAIGDVLYRMKRKGVEGRVFFFRVPFILPSERIFAGGRISLSKIGRAVEGWQYRNAKILKEVVKAFKVGRKILVLAHTKDHLRILHESLPPIIRKRSALYYGTMRVEQMKRAAQRQIILATYGKASEGTDIPDMDTLVLAAPVADIEQSVGRVLRKHADKMKVVILDFVDTHPSLTRWARGRASYYRREGLSIETDIPA